MDHIHPTPDTAASENHVQGDANPQNAEMLTKTTASSNTDFLEGKNSPLDVPQPETKLEHILTDWDGPEDAENPRNWPMGLRVYGVIVPAWYSFAV